LAACSKDLDIEAEGYTVRITYDLNGGTYQGADKIVYAYKPGQPLADLIMLQRQPERVGYHVEGYYRSFENGVYGAPVDFSRDKAENDVTLYVRWQENYFYSVVYTDVESGADIEVGVYTTSPGGTFSINPSNVKRDGYTLLGFYKTSDVDDDANKWDAATVHPGGETIVVKVYTKWLEGDWTLVDNASQLTALSPVVNYYLLNDIDFAGKSWHTVNFGAKLEGNGYKISNVALPEVKTSSYGKYYYGLFGEIAATAEINNVAFENVTLTVNLERTGNAEIYAALFAGTVADDAKIQNVTVKGTLTVLKVNYNFAYLHLGAAVADPDAKSYAAGIDDGAVAFDNQTDNYTDVPRRER
jgi:hypothetical protein